MSLSSLIQELLSGGHPSIASGLSGLGDELLRQVIAQYGSGTLNAPRVRAVSASLDADDAWNLSRALGVAEMYEGRWSEAAAAFADAGRLAPAELSAVVRIPEIDCRARAGSVVAAIRLGRKLVRSLNADVPQQARARINLANALEQADDLRTAMREYQLAIEGLGDHFPGDRLKALSGLAWCAASLGRYSVAEAAAAEAHAGFTESGQASLAAVVAGSWALALIAQGKPDAGLQLLSESAGHIPESQQGWYSLIQGDCLYALNLWDEADHAYKQSLAKEATDAIHANAHMGRAFAAAHLEQTQQLPAHLARARRTYGRLSNPVMLAWCDLVEARALGKTLGPETATILRKAGWKSLAEEASILAAPDRATLLKVASRGSHGSRWKAALALSRMSEGADRVRWQSFVIRTILELRAELRSTSARSSFLADKSAALSEIIMEWLRSDSRALWRKAQRAILDTRAITLVDEISGQLPADQQAILVRLRAELDRGVDGENLPPSLRRGSLASVATPLQRQVVQTIQAFSKPPIQSAAHLFVAGPSGVGWVSPNGHRHLLDLSPCELRCLVERAHFELFSPLVGFEQEAEIALEMLRDLREQLQVPDVAIISPEGFGWDIPWQALTDNEVGISLCPALTTDHNTYLGSGPVVLWAAANQSLPHIEAEIEHLRSRFPDAKVCRTREEALRSLELPKISLLHIAAHGRHRPTNPMFSHVEFADGPVSAYEIATAPTQVELAVLMSCESGKVTSYRHSEPDGLVRAILARGAQAAIGSSWLLDDRAAFALQEKLYGALLQGQSATHGLSAARAELQEQWPHPFYWGAPVLFAGYWRETSNEMNRKPSRGTTL